VRLSHPLPLSDLAVLTLHEPVPAGVEPAPLRCPRPEDLVSKAWWAFGFPEGDLIGNSADGVVGAWLALGWVRLDAESRYQVRPGFSGGGLWSPDYQAVVGVVGQAHGNGDGRAITLRQADLCFPDHKLVVLASWSARTAGEVAMQQWGWTLESDPEGDRHWRPRARGVSIESERGYRFRGRAAALAKIVQWLDRPDPDRRVLIVTGSPGVGKSAVLGRIVTTADPVIRASLPAADDSVKASPGTVSCAVHVKGKTALEVAEEIARAASARIPGQPDELAPVIRAALARDPAQRFNLIIDALDEAVSPAQARTIVDKIVLPLAETCSDVGVQVIVGTRRRDDGGDILGRFADALVVLDLDSPEHFAEEDLAAYALACLRLDGDERPGNPYADDGLAVPLADRIAALSGQNFLVAGLIARSHGLHDEEAADPGELAFTTTVDVALAQYLRRLSPVDGLPADAALTALAFAEAPGFSAELWRLAVEAITGARVSTEGLMRFAQSSAANFLVETGSSDTSAPGGERNRVYRLFHQALNDALLRARADILPRGADERALTAKFIRHGQASSWEDAPPYTLRSLPRHADLAGLVDDLLCDDAYLLHADLRRLLQVCDNAQSARGSARAKLLRLTPSALIAGPHDRAALFSVTEALESLGTAYSDTAWKAPYHALWAWARPRTERAVLEGHEGSVYGLCSVEVGARQLLASGGDDKTVRIWDPQTGEQRAVLEGHKGPVRAVCPVQVDGRQLIASASADKTVRIWDPRTGEQRTLLEGHQGSVRAVCPVQVDGRQLIASASADKTVRIWDPRTGEQRVATVDNQENAYAVCPVEVDGRQLIAIGADSGRVRMLDPESGERRGLTVAGPALLDWINAVCLISLDEQRLIASADGRGMVRIWDPVTGEQRAVWASRQGVLSAVCPVDVGGLHLLASAGSDGTVRIWNPQTAEQDTDSSDRPGTVKGVCPVEVEGRQLLASGGDDRTVRIWDPQTGEQRASLKGQQGYVRAVCSVEVEGRQLLASGDSEGRVRTWEPATGQQRAVFKTFWGYFGEIRDMCMIVVHGTQMLATVASGSRTIRIRDPKNGQERSLLKGTLWTGIRRICPAMLGERQLLAGVDSDGTLQTWDPQSGNRHPIKAKHVGEVNGLCSLVAGERQLLAGARSDKTVRIWDLQTLKQCATLEGHRARVNAVCSLTIDGRVLLASAANDRAVRVWDPQAGTCLLTMPTHYAALAVGQVGDFLAIVLNSGLLVVKINIGGGALPARCLGLLPGTGACECPGRDGHGDWQRRERGEAVAGADQARSSAPVATE
jgi:WD40 repeat protein